MPKRTNDFQQLIYLIHRQLIGEATVTESKFLHDSAANIDREVDIVIETQVGSYPLIMGIECQGRGRIANVEWIEQMASKHDTLPTDKLILVSQSGFTPAARTKAKAKKIETMTLGQAIQADWNGLVGRATVLLVKWGIHPAGCIAQFTRPDGQMNSLQLDLNQQLYDKKGHDILTVSEIIDIIIDMHYEDIIKEMRSPDTDNQKPYTIFKLEFGLHEGIYHIDTSEIKREISQLLIIGHCFRESELVDLQSGSFGSAQVAFGKTHSVDANSFISIVEHEDKPNTAALILSSEKSELRIVDLKVAKRETD